MYVWSSLLLWQTIIIQVKGICVFALSPKKQSATNTLGNEICTKQKSVEIDLLLRLETPLSDGVDAVKEWCVLM
jgi:hypothetical protein